MREKECVCEIGEILVWVWWDWWEYDDGLVAAVTQKNAGSVTVSSSPTLAQDGPADPWPLRTHNITESVLQSFRDTQDRDCKLLNILLQEESRDPWPSWTEKEQVIEKRFCSPATHRMSSRFLFCYLATTERNIKTKAITFYNCKLQHNFFSKRRTMLPQEEIQGKY